MDEEQTQLSQRLQAALDEIESLLRQMLLLSELSAGEGRLDRDGLQRVLERLRQRIDRIADDIDEMTKN